MRRSLVLAGLTLAVTSVLAQVPASELAKPPAEARHFVIQSTGGKHGDSWTWVAPDGARMGRESMNLRGQVFELDSTARAGADGLPSSVAIRGVTPQGDAAETFSVANGTASWKSPVDEGKAAYSAPAFYVSQGGPIAGTAWFVESLLASPDKSLDLLPGGKARAARLIDLEVGTGQARQTITLWSVIGIGTSPLPVWADANNRFFAITFGIAWLPEAYTGEQTKIEAAQAAAMAEQAPGLAKALVTIPAGPVVFTGVRLFDADAIRFLPDQTVVVDKGAIAAVGARESVPVPPGAQVIDGRGKTLLPGLWDSHMHVGDDYTGLQELSLGVTSVRDPGNDDLRTLERRKRAAAGALLTPHVYASSLIDGKGTYTAQVANVATSEAEAIALVGKAKANGFTGVKFYGTFNPAWLPASIREAHKLGLHVHGHIPAGMRPVDAIAAGYDEITHINWVMMQAMPDSVIPVSNGIMRFEGPGRYAKDVTLGDPRLETIIGAMVSKRIYQRSDDGRVRELVRAREWRLVARLCAVPRHAAANHGTQLQDWRLRRAQGPHPRGLPCELGEDGWPARQNAPGGRSHRRGHRWVRHRDRARARDLRGGRAQHSAGARGGDDRPGAAGAAGRQDRFSEGGQDRRPGARRRRSVGAYRRSAPDARRDAGREAARSRCAAESGRVSGRPK